MDGAEGEGLAEGSRRPRADGGLDALPGSHALSAGKLGQINPRVQQRVAST